MKPRLLICRICFSGLFFALLCGLSDTSSSSELFLRISESPRAPLVAAILFAVTAFGVFPPLTAVFLLSGAIFKLKTALLFSLAGSALSFSVAYCFGAHGKKAEAPLLKALGGKGKRAFFPAFILRAVRLLPYGATGIYMGRARMPFWGYLSGSLAGVTPTMLITVSAGAGLSEKNVLATEVLILCGAFFCISALWLVWSVYK